MSRWTSETWGAACCNICFNFGCPQFSLIFFSLGQILSDFPSMSDLNSVFIGTSFHIFLQTLLGIILGSQNSFVTSHCFQFCRIRKMIADFGRNVHATRSARTIFNMRNFIIHLLNYGTKYSAISAFSSL